MAWFEDKQQKLRDTRLEHLLTTLLLNPTARIKYSHSPCEQEIAH